MSTELFATTTLTAHEHIGFELGWDHAHHGVLPPAPYMQEPSALRDGALAGQATFGQRTLLPTRHVRKWLQLRLQAWLRGRSFETMQVTPHYLQQLDVTYDIYGLSGEQLLELLPPEFDVWRGPQLAIE